MYQLLIARMEKKKKRIVLESGPGMVTFSHDDKYAYISSSFDGHLWIVDTKTKKIIKKTNDAIFIFSIHQYNTRWKGSMG